MARYAVLGSGQVGQVLAKGLRSRGHEVRIGSRAGGKLAEFTAATGIADVPFAEAVSQAEIVILAVAGRVAEDLVGSLADGLSGKVVLDATNPIGGPPVDGFLPYFTGPEASLMERLEARAPGARFVKAFNSVGNAFMVDPAFPGGRPTMFICGRDAEAKAVATALLDSFGWDAEDVGGAASARAVEALCQLWCAPGFLRGDWARAYRVLRP